MNDQELRHWIQKNFGVIPKDLTNYRMALTTRQYEVLEFFGDSILGFIISEYLFVTYSHFIDKPGWFNDVRRELVANKNLTLIAQKMHLASVAIIPSTSSREQVTDDVVADILEALIAAIYQDQGLKKCQKVIENIFDLEKITTNLNNKEGMINLQKARQKFEKQMTADRISSLKQKHPISALQEFLAQKGESPPEYTEISRAGEPHQLLFTIEANCKFKARHLVAEGKGSSKQEAKKAAAQNLLIKIIELYKKS